MYKLSSSIKYGLMLHGMLQADFAYDLKVTEQHVSCLVNDKYGTTFDTAEKMAGIFGVPLSEFIGWGEV